MGWVEGVVTVLTGWAWPTVVLICVLVLKRQIAQLIGRLTHLSGPGVEAKFREQVETASELAEAISPEAPDEQPPTKQGSRSERALPTLSELLAVAEINPFVGALTAWNAVSRTLGTIADIANVRLRTEGNTVVKLRILGIISDEVSALYKRLSNLRSQIVHTRASLDTEEAKEFITAAWRLVTELNRVIDRQPIPPDEGPASDIVG